MRCVDRRPGILRGNRRCADYLHPIPSFLVPACSSSVKTVWSSCVAPPSGFDAVVVSGDLHPSYTLWPATTAAAPRRSYGNCDEIGITRNATSFTVSGTRQPVFTIKMKRQRPFSFGFSTPPSRRLTTTALSHHSNLDWTLTVDSLIYANALPSFHRTRPQVHRDATQKY